jgi:hypothetical protein
MTIQLGSEGYREFQEKFCSLRQKEYDNVGEAAKDTFQTSDFVKLDENNSIHKYPEFLFFETAFDLWMRDKQVDTLRDMLQSPSASEKTGQIVV